MNTNELPKRDKQPSWHQRFVRLFRPMSLRQVPSFTDCVMGETVNFYVDEEGRAWMATNPRKWLNFRVRAPGYDLPNAEDERPGPIGDNPLLRHRIILASHR